jgi:hypothetical protein
MHHTRFGTMAPVLLALLVFSAGTACAPSSTDLLRPEGMPGLDAQGRAPSYADIEYAVKTATATKQGWTITDEEPGAIHATARGGGHEASVRIDYDANGWKIEYVSSSAGLKYDPDYGGREIIHRRYNFWVQQLNAAIEQTLRARMATR